MGTHVDYKLSEVDSPVFQTCSEEKEKVILQLGTACPERAVKAAKLCEAEIAGVDVNMGKFLVFDGFGFKINIRFVFGAQE